MNFESLRIADQIRRAFHGEAWHGASVRELLDGVTAEQALARPLPSAHNIWELVLHIQVYNHAALAVTQGIPMPQIYGTEKDWSNPSDTGSIAWVRTMNDLFDTADRIVQAVEKFDDIRLTDIVPGRPYNYYHLFHGLLQHSLFHAGQLAILKRA